VSSERHYTLVTGASSGIGRGICETLSVDRPLILGGRDLSRLRETLGTCHGEGHILWSMDLSKAMSVGDSLGAFLKENGLFVDSFVHSAGMVDVRPARMAEYEKTLEVMNVNFFSAAEIIRVLLGNAYNKKSLRNVLLISSIFSKLGAKGQGAYCASKGAIDSYVRSLAVELAPTVRVNSLLPGAVKTPMAEKSSPEYLERCDAAHPLGMGEIVDVALYARFILSNDARWVTGQNIVLDGGFSSTKDN